ncbi:uncharacterized protein LOC129584374 [Paramacrobiotus metropolitanus]|uniref:uncharacterized protein LOC129584374 n=1 Tax=Paramacrobiotus metropolitanus TaxID=2943436 RepID=UPI002445FC79|nr:uncharacterized protein LOC129584374 [Paramacrobiotus metropolitanus]
MPSASLQLALLALLGWKLVDSTAPNPAQGSCDWPLDPFFGTYDMNWAQQVNMMNLTNGVVGIPPDVVLGGERQVFNKTADGSKYQQFLIYSDPVYNKQVAFVCGVTDTLSLGGPASLTYTFTMLDAKTLQGSYTISVAGVGTVASFVVKFAFQVTGDCGFFDTVTVAPPQNFVATAPFDRVQGYPRTFVEVLQGILTWPFFTWYCAFKP